MKSETCDAIVSLCLCLSLSLSLSNPSTLYIPTIVRYVAAMSLIDCIATTSLLLGRKHAGDGGD